MYLSKKGKLLKASIMEDYQIIESQISDVRLILGRVQLELPEDNSILDAFENLAVFVTEKFKIPASQKKLVYDNLGIDYSVFDISNEIIKNNTKLNGYFSLELKLRGIGCIFSWVKPENIELQDLIKLKYLIAKLHALIGDKIFSEVFASL
jgi:hypothetical protein